MMSPDQQRELGLFAAHADVGFAVGHPDSRVNVRALFAACKFEEIKFFE